jgi:hypothetical protein
VNGLSGIFGTVFQALTGQDPNAISAQLSAAEQQLTLAVQVVITLLTLSLVAQIFIVLELRRK